MNTDKAFARLDAITTELAPLEDQRGKLRQEASRLALDLIKAGAPPTEVARRSPFSAAYLRALARGAGLPPGKPGGSRNARR